MSSTVNNPTNVSSGILPLTTPRVISLKRRPKGDLFNHGKDFDDEGVPLFTTEHGEPATLKPAIRLVPGILPVLTPEEQDALAHPDETSQGKHINYTPSAIVADIDAKLITSTEKEMRQGKFREAHFPTIDDWRKSQNYKRLRESKLLAVNSVLRAKKSYFDNGKEGIILDPRITESFQKMDKGLIKRLKESGGGTDFFAGDLDRPPEGFVPNWDQQARDREFTPLLSGPYNKQLYWFDYLDMHSKCFESWTHNPISKRICKLIPQFVLGKSVKATVVIAEHKTGNVETDPKTGKEKPQVVDLRDKCQHILDEHWQMNSMILRSKMILRDLIIFGEQFVRYFQAPWGLKVRQLDPSTVWEVITDPDDAEQIFFLHQQYPTRYLWMTDINIPTIKFIIRQVPALHFYHMKINTVAGEVRGRSELFAILGWLKRLKEFASDRVTRNKMANLYVLDVSVEGGPGAVDEARAQFNTPPAPGSFFIHNKAAELQGIRAEVGSGDVIGDWEMLLTIIAVGAGISQEYLGLPRAGTKAAALIGTEPDIKTFEDYQEIMEAFFQQDSKRVFDRARETGKIPKDTRIVVEITYPSLAEENRSEKLKDMAFLESMSWLSHRRTASMAAKEMSITSYNYDEEQEDIAEEIAQQQILINKAYAQMLKGQQEQAQPGGAPPRLPGGETAPAGESKKRWNGDPRDIRASIIREAANLAAKKLDRKRYASFTPERVRDQKSLNRHDILVKGKRAAKRDYNESRSRIRRFPREIQ